jgi:hypothetical protein
MRQERYWLVSGHGSLGDVRLWSDHNMLKTPGGPVPMAVFTGEQAVSTISVAPRTAGHLGAIQAAYRSGQVFLGKVDVPIIEVRHYLDDQLDMHHSFASFATRLRLVNGNGHHRNHLIWVAAPPFDPTRQAFALIDEWLSEGRPETAQDACWDERGESIALGAGVWNGSWNGRATQKCLQRFPAFKSPRDAAGGPLSGDVFKCHLQTLEAAMTNGTYAEVDMRPHKRWLRQIFPDGVCDFSKGDAGRPEDLNVP